jgi:hypothetical protein
MRYFVYAVALLLLASAAIFIKAALFDKRPQKTGLILAVLAIPLYLVYYNDRFNDLWHQFVNGGTSLRMRDVVEPLGRIQHGNPAFASDIAPAGLVAIVLLTHITVFQRVAVRRRLQRVHDPIANFFALATISILIGGTLVSTFAWGWVGSLVVTGVFILVYLGALALLGAIIEVIGALSKLFLVWLKRKVFTVATWITRVSSWISSLSGRLVSRAWIEQIREDTANQESLFLREQDAQDRALYEAYLRDRNRKRRMLQKRGIPVGPELEPYDALTSGPQPKDGPKPPIELLTADPAPEPAVPPPAVVPRPATD